VPRKPSPFVALLADLKRVCDALGLGWYVFGAQAALLYGSARLTADVDITVRLDQLTPEAFAERLRAAGFVLRIDDPAFIRTTRVLPVLHRATGIPVDVVLAGPGLEEMFLERAQSHRLAGITVPVAIAEDIVVMKLLASRDKDREDVVAILGAQGAKLDLSLVRSTLQVLQEALGQSDLLPALEQALAKAHSGRRR
jgi:hypothetical protein